MSEYQYYEFLALDRALTQHDMRELRKYSTRATITATRFVNHYEWGDFKGNPSTWMQKYFDAFLYFANWGTHRLMLRLPSQALDIKTAKRYLRGHSSAAHVKGDLLILDLMAENEGGDREADDNTGLLSSLIPLRADIAAGDHRALYLAWLSSVQSGELNADEPEPPIPPGLGALSAPLKALADFLYVGADLIAVAAVRSQPVNDRVAREQFGQWIAGLPESEKAALLSRLAIDNELGLRAELLRRYHRTRPTVGSATVAKSRTVAELLDEVELRERQRLARAGRRQPQRRSARRPDGDENCR
jgi:hypothetical protein